jgi:sporadic carbohydrate cluster protein (TIGR04323 family)
MANAPLNVKGYATPREFSGFQIPIPLQSAAIRRYCDEHGLVFNHHVVENITPGTYLVLERIVAEAHLFQAMAMCSIGMLPGDRAHRNDLLEGCVRTGLVVHFLFEQIILRTKEDVALVNEILSLMWLSKSDSGRFVSLRSLVNTT